MSTLRAATARLAHDVGKYVARTARNLSGELTPPLAGPLLDMLCRDLYGSEKEVRPSRLFAQLAAPIAEQTAEPRLERVGAIFVELDAMEEQVRGGERAAVVHAVRLACEIEESLRGMARQAAGGGK